MSVAVFSEVRLVTLGHSNFSFFAVFRFFVSIASTKSCLYGDEVRIAVFPFRLLFRPMSYFRSALEILQMSFGLITLKLDVGLQSICELHGRGLQETDSDYGKIPGVGSTGISLSVDAGLDVID